MNHPAESVPPRRTTNGAVPRRSSRPGPPQDAGRRPRRDAAPATTTTLTVPAPASASVLTASASTATSRSWAPRPRTPRRTAGGPAAPTPTAAELARQRRSRRNARISSTLHGGAPVELRRFSARQVPFVAVLVALLGVGLAGVLWLNTLTDEAGIRTNGAKAVSAQSQLRIEELESEIATKNATPSLAAAARRLGLVPAGDTTILVVPTDGAAPTVVGTPTPVVDPVAEAAAAQAAAQAAADQAAAQQAAQAAAQAAAQQAADAATQAAAQQSAAQQAANAAATQQAVGAATAPESAAAPTAAATPVAVAPATEPAAAQTPTVPDTATASTPGVPQ